MRIPAKQNASSWGPNGVHKELNVPLRAPSFEHSVRECDHRVVAPLFGKRSRLAQLLLLN